MRAATTCFVLVLSLLQIGTAVAVIAITAIHLGNITSFQDAIQLNQSRCLATTDTKDMSVCAYIYSVGGVSIVLTIIIGLLQLITCNMCGCGKYMDAVFTALASAWWLVAGFITAAHAKAANSANPRPLPRREWRNAVVLLCWVTSGLFATLFVVHMMRIGLSCCRKRRKNADSDMEKANLRKVDRPPSAAVELGKEVASRPYMMGRSGSKNAQQNNASKYLNPHNNI